MAPQDSFIDDEEDTWYVCLLGPWGALPPEPCVLGQHWVPELTTLAALSASKSLISLTETSDHVPVATRYDQLMAPSAVVGFLPRRANPRIAGLPVLFQQYQE